MGSVDKYEETYRDIPDRDAGPNYCWDTWDTCPYARIIVDPEICLVNTLKIHIKQKLIKYKKKFQFIMLYVTETFYE